MTSYNRRSQSAGPSDQELEAIITRTDGTETLVQWADRLGKALEKQGLGTSQIRALFGEVRQIQGDLSTKGWPQAKRRLLLLKPKMAYRAHKDRQVKGLVDVLDPALDLVVHAPSRPEGERAVLDNTQEDNFQRFVDFFEAILAYHKAHGGKS